MRTLINRQTVLFSLLLAQAIMLAAFVIGTSFYINHDAALYLQCGQLILDGKTPYVDFYDNNPPLIMVLSCVPVLLSKLTNFSLMASFAIFVICLIGLSTALIYKLSSDKNDGFNRLWFMLSAWFVFHLLTAICRDFGQREHLFVICSAPYLVLRITRFNSSLISFSLPSLFFTGFYAGVGIFLKPHFLIIVFLFELVLLSSAYQIRLLLKPEIAGLAFLGFLYVGIFLLSKSIRTNYLELIAPLVAEGNWVYYIPFKKLMAIFHPLQNSRNLYFLLCLCLILVTALLNKNYLSTDRQHYLTCLALMSATATALASYFYQAKGWPYHLVPFCFFSGFGFVYCVSALMGQNSIIKWNDSIRVATMILVLACTTFLELRYYRIRRSLESTMLHVMENDSSVNNRIIVFSTSMSAYPAMIQANMRPGSRFLWFFPFALLYANAHDPKLTEEEILNLGPLDVALEARFLRELTDDILELKPGLIMINSISGDQGLPYRLHFKNYLAHHKILDLIQSRYRLVKKEVTQRVSKVEYELWSLKPELK